jgi:uncharacterized protein
LDITPLIAADRQIIQSYNAQGFKVSGQRFAGNVCVFVDQTCPWEFAGTLADLTPRAFSDFDISGDALDVVLLGTGGQMGFAPNEVKAFFKSKGVILESMDTGAACRTYNVLMTEGRRIATFLMTDKL